jgi:hypothetical protein
MTGWGRFTFFNLLRGKRAAGQMAPAAAGEGERAPAGAPHSGAKGLGLEIANIAALRDAEDYARDAFYIANFAPSEIAHCMQQPKVKAAFQGLLAAKRAIIKSGAASEPSEGLSKIEAGFDNEGRPIYPGCLVSVSDTGTIVAAACIWLAGVAIGAVTAQRTIRVFPVRSRIYAFLVLMSLLLLFALGVWKLLELAR